MKRRRFFDEICLLNYFGQKTCDWGLIKFFIYYFFGGIDSFSSSDTSIGCSSGCSSFKSSSSINSSSSTSDGFSVGSNQGALFQLEISAFLLTLEMLLMILRTFEDLDGVFSMANSLLCVGVPYINKYLNIWPSVWIFHWSKHYPHLLLTFVSNESLFTISHTVRKSFKRCAELLPSVNS